MTKNTVINFARLDYLTTAPYLTWRIILIFTAAIAFIAAGTSNTTIIISMCMMCSVVFACYPFTIGLDTLYFTLPLTKKNVILGRYVFTISLNLAMLLVAYILSFTIMTIFSEDFDWLVNLLTGLACFGLFTFIEAIQLPIYFKMGYTKAKFLAYVPLIAFPASVLAMTAFIDKDKLIPILTNIFTWIENNMIITVLACLLVWTGMMFLSMLVSFKFYIKREF
jgi:hypothetical protein